MTAQLFSLYPLLSGAQQGIITWLFREHVPAARRNWVHAALHYGGVLIYLLLVAYCGYVANWHGLLGLLVEASLARALLFDPALNTARSWFNHREGRAWGNLFEVGTTAASDKALRWLAAKLRWPPERLRGLLWVVTGLVAIGCRV